MALAAIGCAAANQPLRAGENVPLLASSIMMHDSASGVPRALEDARVKMNDAQFETLLRTISAHVTASIGLYTYDADSWWLHDTDLRYVADVRRELVMPLVIHRSVDGSFWDTLKPIFEKQDGISGKHRGVGKMLLLRSISERWGGVHPVELEESAAYVARNLMWRGVTRQPHDQEVAYEVREINERRETLGRESLFAHHVIIVSHGEINDSDMGVARAGDPRFATATYVGKIMHRHTAESTDDSFVTHLTPAVHNAAGYRMTKQSLVDTKRLALEFLGRGSDPVTLVLDGHGLADAFYLSDEEIDDEGKVQLSASTHKISVEEMADTFEEHWKRQHEAYPDDVELNISMIVHACWSQSYVRNIVTELQRRNVPLPHLMITSAEYGQTTIAHWENPYGTVFDELIASSKTARDVIVRKHMVPDSNPSVFVPRPEGPHELRKTLMQIGDISSRNKVAAAT